MSRYVPRHLAARSRPWWRRRAAASCALAVAAFLTAGAGGVLLVGDEDAPPRTVDVATGSSGEVSGIPVVERPARPEGAPAPAVLAPSPPVLIEVPAIGVSSALEALGLGEDGTMAAPTDFQVAGWFAPGTEPGQPGPAVVAGHVDSQDGPAVFHRLGELTIGAEILVHREDGSIVRFLVTGMQSYPKEAFPTAAVYGPVPGPELRLVTCDGAFDQAQGAYLENLVVYAGLASG